MSSASPGVSCWRRVLIAWWWLGHAALLYALLTRFRAPAPPRVRFVPTRPPTGRTVRLVGCLRVATCCRVLVALLWRLFCSRSALTCVFVVGVEGGGERELWADGCSGEVRVR